MTKTPLSKGRFYLYPCQAGKGSNGAALEAMEGSDRMAAHWDALKEEILSKDGETAQHHRRVGEFALWMGDSLGLTASDRSVLHLAATLHDVGKLVVGDEILKKTSPLSGAEWEEMRRHVEWGARIVGSLEGEGQIADLILSHHERWDGGGYPRGLRGEQIPFLARIISVADSFDAMITDRCYRRALALPDAVAELVRGKGTQFDPVVVDAFLEACGERGLPVRLQAAHYGMV